MRPYMRQTLGSYLVLCLAAIVGFAGLVALPQSARDFLNVEYQLAAHFLLEVFAIVVAFMIASLAWHERDPDYQDMAKVLLMGFTLVASLDVLHLMNSNGMPGFITPSNPEKARFFWAVARSAEVATLFLLGLRASLPGYKLWWLLVAACGSGLLFLLGTFEVQQWKHFQLTAGLGAGPFDIIGLLICIANFFCAALFYSQWRSSQDPYHLHLAATCFVLGIGQMAFLHYFVESQALYLGGHLFKVIVYCLLYHGFFQKRIVQPYEKIQALKVQSATAQKKWENVWMHMPVEVIVLDQNFNYLKATPMHTQRLNKQLEELQGRPWKNYVNKEQKETILPLLKSLANGRPVDFELEIPHESGETQHIQVDSVPLKNFQGDFAGLVAVLKDTTERNKALKLLESSYKDLNDLKVALDAHAIVAVTDARGVITKVNDKFCQISQYRRGELLGQDHRLLNSGFHPSEFFGEMWRTIAAGKAWTGEVCNRAKDGSLYWVHSTIVPFIGEDGIPEQYIAIRANITERKKAEQRSQTMALYDMLTGLPNRHFLGEHLRMLIARSLQGNQYNALLLLDLDNFKDVNDSLGHTRGDELLCQAAKRIRALVREDDVVARLGGDEFVILLGSLDEEEKKANIQAENMAEKVRYSLEQAFDFEGIMVHSSCSIGLTLFQGKNINQEEVLQRAEMALYRAKEHGRNQICAFEPSMQEEMLWHAAVMHDLRVALDREQFRVFYQVLVDKDQKPAGYEALLRWIHPERGMVSPLSFIPKAEESGLIVSIGQWVMLQACQQLAIWAQQPEMAKLTISINISARQLRDADFHDSVQNILRTTGANPELLCLELTESMFHTDLQQSIQKMKRLRLLGVKFALDDFGTGYSSLSYLKRLPLHELKIDKSFVDEILIDENAAAIAKTILVLAQTLQLMVVAEGIEHLEQFEWLREQGCHLFQGYYFGKPQPIEP
ncbi:MAG: EAL domain-containing protein [Comamonas sp.]|nr:EAL domain-containing protein [Comamonas sp.]